MQEKIQNFKQIVKTNFSRLDFEYHEWMIDYHLNIVERIALEICDKYPNADRDLVQTLVWFHDFGKPLSEERERELTLSEGPKVLRECGFDDEFIQKVVEYWTLMEKKNEMDLSTAPIEVQIISSADGASHLTGVFYPSYFGDGNNFPETQRELREKIEKDWNRKIVIPEVKEAFRFRYERARELLGEFPERFI